MYLQEPAFVFPAFANNYTHEAKEALPGLEIRFREMLTLFSEDLARFDFVTNNFLGDEFLTQVITYAYSCAVSDMLREKGYRAAYVSGFSMGIYSALYHAGSITYKTGLDLLSKAYHDSVECLPDETFTMGTVIGLSPSDVNGLVEKYRLPLEIINQSSPVTITVSGPSAPVRRLLEEAIGEGALKTHILNVSVPYHTHYLEPVAVSFSVHARNAAIHPPTIPVLSQIDQRILHTADDIREELVKNLFRHMNSMNAHETLLSLGVKTFVECGPGRGMKRNARFLEGDFRFYHPSELLSESYLQPEEPPLK
ncbi:MAG TPA: ACP S-malonyltransferase [Bacteroidales bacterium]|nr:ACP S-malonyltransferase [Bacteroidales bacterium]HPS73302.1 ACP S-malonyltransferase [Bacteroidales bacterium]